MSNLPVADLLAAAVIVICIIISLTRGIIAEAGAMVAWVVSFIAARTLAMPFADVVFKFAGQAVPAIPAPITIMSKSSAILRSSESERTTLT